MYGDGSGWLAALRRGLGASIRCYPGPGARRPFRQVQLSFETLEDARTVLSEYMRNEKRDDIEGWMQTPGTAWRLAPPAGGIDPRACGPVFVTAGRPPDRKMARHTP